MHWPTLTEGRLLRRYKRFLADYDTISSEVKLDPATRLDFLLTGSKHPPVYMEVKKGLDLTSRLRGIILVEHQFRRTVC